MNKNRTFIRLFAMLLAVTLAFGCVSMTAFAATNDQKEVKVWLFYFDDEYVEMTAWVDEDATKVDMSVLRELAVDAGVKYGTGPWYIHSNADTKIKYNASNPDLPGYVWADVEFAADIQILPPDPGGTIDPPAPPSEVSKEVTIYYLYQGRNVGSKVVTVPFTATDVSTEDILNNLPSGYVLPNGEISSTAISSGCVSVVVDQPMIEPGPTPATKEISIYYLLNGVQNVRTSLVTVPYEATEVDVETILENLPSGYVFPDGQISSTEIKNGCVTVTVTQSMIEPNPAPATKEVTLWYMLQQENVHKQKVTVDSKATQVDAAVVAQYCPANYTVQPGSYTIDGSDVIVYVEYNEPNPPAPPVTEDKTVTIWYLFGEDPVGEKLTVTVAGDAETVDAAVVSSGIPSGFELLSTDYRINADNNVLVYVRKAATTPTVPDTKEVAIKFVHHRQGLIATHSIVVPYATEALTADQVVQYKLTDWYLMTNSFVIDANNEVTVTFCYTFE